MRQYVARRLALFVPTLVGASLLVFVLMRLVPGDIAEILVYQTGSESSVIQTKQIQQIRAELGLDRPVAIQYLAWMGGALRGDFGQSYTQRRPVWDILAERVPRSLELAVLTLAIAVVWAIPLGVISAVRQNSWLDYAARVLSLSGLSLPLFVTGVLILYGLVRLFRWIPPLEFVAFTENPVENLKQLIWPALCQAYYISAPITRLTRSEMLEVIRHDYVRTARAKGLAEPVVMMKHVLRNAMIPILTNVAVQLPSIFVGSFLIEVFFSIPGLGREVFLAVNRSDYPVIQAVTVYLAVLTMLINLGADLLYKLVDPRVELR